MMSRTPDSEYTSLRKPFLTQGAYRGDAKAYVFLGRDLKSTDAVTYKALGQSVEAIARRLSTPVRPSDRVLLVFNNDPDAVQLFWDSILAGLITLPAPAPGARNNQTGESRLLGMATDIGVALALTRAEHFEATRANAKYRLAHPANSPKPPRHPAPQPHLCQRYLALRLQPGKLPAVFLQTSDAPSCRPTNGLAAAGAVRRARVRPAHGHTGISYPPARPRPGRKPSRHPSRTMTTLCQPEVPLPHRGGPLSDAQRYGKPR